jgi:putative transposase
MKNQNFYIYSKKMFKGHCFPEAIRLQAVYFKLRFSLSYRDVEELLFIRGVKVDHATIQRWVFKFTPLVEQQFRKRKKLVGKRWRLDDLIDILYEIKKEII